MQRLLFKFLAPAILFATPLVSELPASTFGGSTGPRQSADENLPRIEVDGNTYRRTKARLSVEDVAPLTLPTGSYTVKKSEEAIVEYNKTFLVVPRD
ncbi:MAG TPA: hypothetical protein VE954_30685 [Oligoflexus sp.]|uniref:hypothetical protein n=1 Tax=Oligoflexus sp. TaxID=1971216 RepID=UPI002D41AF51|nr:hypothetical protein [Oligoflexus sp.]HYX37492.1 hypothetical protein [Oligoflexus sp.]